MRRFLLVSAAIASSACGVIPRADVLLPAPTEVTADVPAQGIENWIEPAGNELPQTDWVAGFADEALSSLIHEALEKNTDVRIASARYDRALAQFKNARADRFPSLRATTNRSRSEPFGGGGVINIPGGGVIPVGGGTTNLDIGVDATLSLIHI